MQNFLIGIIAAVLVYSGLVAGGLGVARFLMPAPPNLYRTSIYDITLPQGWTCALEGTETVCTPQGEPPHRAILIAAMKFRNPEMDTINAYTAHLGKPKNSVLPDGKKMTSTVERVDHTVIDGRTWVDATHLESEVPGYRTRYLASLTAQVGIAITFSTIKNDYEIYQPVLDRTVSSINIYQSFNETTEKVFN